MAQERSVNNGEMLEVDRLAELSRAVFERIRTSMLEHYPEETIAEIGDLAVAGDAYAHEELKALGIYPAQPVAPAASPEFDPAPRVAQLANPEVTGSAVVSSTVEQPVPDALTQARMAVASAHAPEATVLTEAAQIVDNVPGVAAIEREMNDAAVLAATEQVINGAAGQYSNGAVNA